MAKTVAVLGGGVAGLSAAHELIERGFDVQLYEGSAHFGGKSRSHPVLGTGTDGRADLPGEHGFRFYPSFYRHLIDTMERIPLADPSKNVAGNLRAADRAAIASADNQTIHEFVRKRPDTPYSVLQSLELFFQDMDVDAADVSLFGLKVLQYLTSSKERRDQEYEPMSWWEFCQGHRFSENFQRYMRAIPRTMVAMDPEVSSARTIGTISMQLILDFASEGVNNDRTMGGPTSEMWIDPWVTHLTGQGVQFHMNKRVTSLNLSGNAIGDVTFEDGTTATADYFVLAVPLDIAHKLISEEIGDLDPKLDHVRNADMDSLLAWMVGIQYFTHEDVPMIPGHVFYPDSKWALTSISQAQFWDQGGLFRQRYGDGSVGGIVSVDISEWKKPGHFVAKTALQCTPDEIAEEVWKQMKRSVNGVGEKEVLADENLHSWHLDDELQYGAFGAAPPINHGRLLVHPPGSWKIRPTANTELDNLVLASDYVQTFTDLATMEGANEAARRAVNTLLDKENSSAPRAGVWKLEEPAGFDFLKELDRKRYQAGKPHILDGELLKMAFGAAELGRKAAKATGLSALDDYVDRFKFSRLIEALLSRLGVIKYP
jgi:uncharacterized protein with NAD-binding domain and iron-sulfur cluster